MISNVLRYSLSAVIAIALVLGVAGAMIRYFDRPKPDPLPAMVREVQLARTADIDIDALLAKQHEREMPQKPVKGDAPEREVQGFVQLAYRVNPDGTVSDVRVLGSVPEGVYDEQAKAIIKSRMYTPDFDADGNAKAREDTDVIQFTVPESRVKSHND